MGRRKSRRWNKCFVWFVTSFGALLYSIKCISATDDSLYKGDSFLFHDDNGALRQGGSCQTSRDLPKQKFLMVVSTLDGKLSALDVADSGNLQWSVSGDSRPLLSSSISQLEINRNGMRTRVIPSLDGDLYQYDGESIEPIPMSADALLTSTFKVSDKSMMIGAKDISSYGIDPASGKVHYICTSEGCKVLESGESNDKDLLVVKRSTQTVRSVDARSGIERWNFSVGNHQIELLPGEKSTHDATQDDDISIQTCPNEDVYEPNNIEENLKIIVPDGMVVALNPDNPETIHWKHKFDSPVAKAWILRGGVLKSVSVFDNKHVPALSDIQPPSDVTSTQPLIYLGLHQNQLYVQPSIPMHQTVSQVAKNNNNQLNVPRVAWKPYLNTAQYRTPIFRGNHRDTRGVLMITDGSDADETGLTVWHENYPFDNGYYLYPDVVLPVNQCDSENNTNTDAPYIIYASLWYYWKEVVAISILMSISVNLMLMRLKKVCKKKNMDLSLCGDLSDSSSSVATEVSEVKKEEFKSRYSQDYEQLLCLGKGGFGIVFEAKNKVDMCSYAVKRITLPSNEQSKEKVKREVRALAMLDHPGIVRYFSAWEESPPLGWQEILDLQMTDSECISMPTPCNSTTQFDIKGKGEDKFDVMYPFGGGLSEEVTFSRNVKAGGSTEFSVSESDSSLNKTSTNSFHILHDVLNEEDSFDVEFRLDDSEDSGSCSNTLPFTKDDIDSNLNNNNNSFSIVFEDSGCAEKSSKSSSSGGIVFMDDDCHSDKHIIDIPSQSDQRPTSLSFSSQSPHTKHHTGSQIIKKSGKSVTPVPKSYLYIQMQLCRRETLKDWLHASANEPQNLDIVLDWFDQIVCAVEYVHHRGLMHRDLKPSNIFFSVDGVIKIGDFGLVTDLTEEELEQCSTDKNPFKKHTAQVGTTLYMSPEQMSGKVYGEKVDIFSLGMILFELLYSFSTQMERVRTLMDVKKKKFPSDFVTDRPTEHAFVDWLLTHDPSQRPTAREILDNQLLQKFEKRHAPKRIRTRTTSSSSSGSLS